VSSFFPETLPQVEDGLRFRVARQAVLASNLANVDTPGYRPADLSFDDALTRAGVNVARTHSRHLGAGGAEAQFTLQRQPLATRPDGNGVDFDQETIRVARNASAFTQTAEVLSRLLSLAQIAIQGRAS
jgi:flagellar basal-body rod protein FlgB